MEDVNMQNIKRGEIFFVQDTGNECGSEQRGVRPAVIVGNDLGNKHSSIVEVTYLTASKKKKLPTHVPIIPKMGRPSTALCESVHTISKERILGNGAGILGNSITEMKATKQFKQPSNVWLLFLSLYIILCV